jgi:serine protease AprX
MGRKSHLLVLVFILVAALLCTGLSRASPPAQTVPASIQLKAAVFVPGRGEAPSIPAGLTISGYAAGQRGYYIVLFRGPVESAWKDQVTALGGEVLEYLPDFAFKVRMTTEQARQVEDLNDAVWVGLFQPAYKLSPTLVRDGTRMYRVRIERGVDVGAVEAAIRRLGVQVTAPPGNILLVGANSAQIEAVARVPDVAWIENFRFRETENEYGAGVTIGADTAHANGYDGSTQIVAVADTGFGDGTKAGGYLDIPVDRIVGIHDWPALNSFCWTAVSDGPQDVDSGHGTHTSGSLLSAGGPSGEGKGAAPAARLIFQAVEDYADMTSFCERYRDYRDGYYLIGLPSDVRDLFQQAYGDGARIHSNSWGSDAQGEYDADAASTDDYMWNHPDFLVTTSAGNAGIDADGDGYVDEDSMGSPATAKNILTAGASEGDRDGRYECDPSLGYVNPSTGTSCFSQDGQNNIMTYGEAWPDAFPESPTASDPTAGNVQQMAAFSSRGPTDDGRVKPDVVAPGTWVLSLYSDLHQEGYDASPIAQNGTWQYDGWGFPLDQHYKYMGGTSVSNVLTAGSAAVVRDFYRKAHGHSASAALTKATLINSAVDMLDENNDGANDNDYPIPNHHEGWGRINVADATDGSHEWIDNTVGLGTGGRATYEYDAGSGGRPLKVTLAWTDYPASTSAAKALVNDLDLTVTAPGGAVFKGNVFSGGWSQTGGIADRTNNVENIYVQSAASGTWTVEVKGYTVPYGPQPFALVVDASFGPVDEPPTVDIANPAEGGTVSGTVLLQIEASDAEDAAGALTVEWNVDDGSWQPTSYDDGSGYHEANWTTTTVDDGEHTVYARVIDSSTNTASDSSKVTVNNPVVMTMHAGDLDGSSGWWWGNWVWRATITIVVHDTDHNLMADVAVSGSWTGGYSGSSTCTTGEDGACIVSSSFIWRGSPSTTFTVYSMSHPALTYQPADNHDPDGDSNGSSITVNRPQ